MSTVTIDAAKTIREVTIHVRVRGMKTMAVRISLAAMIFRLGAWVAGCAVELDVD